MSWEVLEGDCVGVMAAMPEASVDAICTDPPYGLEFMGKGWDAFRIDDTGTARHRGDAAGSHGELAERDGATLGGRLRVGYGGGKRPATNRCVGCGKRDQFRNPHSCPEGTPWKSELIDPHAAPPTMLAFQEWSRTWAIEALRVLKPGGHLLAFGGTRTYHRLACAVEDAGFEIRDCLAWMYGSGFPKSLNLDGERQGWGTALKPAHEPIVLARKPLIGTVASNVLAHGTGALNVDGCRIEGVPDSPGTTPTSTGERGTMSGDLPRVAYVTPSGRWPANVLLDPEAAAMLDEQTGTLHSQDPATRGVPGKTTGVTGFAPSVNGQWYGDSGGASRFFYCAKASSAERNAGLEGFEGSDEFRTQGAGRSPVLRCPEHEASIPSGGTTYSCGCAQVWDGREGRPAARANSHPTVKPIELMRWLVRLVTPPGGRVLDPFTGSGTTGCAAVLEGFDFVGVERDPEYGPIARARIGWWAEHPDGMELVDRLEAEKARAAVAEAGQVSLFDLLG